MSNVNYGEKAQQVWEAAIATGLDVAPVSKLQAHALLQYGYSRIECGGSYIAARREGEGVIGSTPIWIDYDDPEWVAKCVDILSSGRTVECGKGVGLRAITDRVHFQTCDYPLAFLAQVIRRPEDPWQLDPDYQRDHVWTDRQRVLFMGHLLENGRMPLIFLQDGAPYEVIDGKQRLTACLKFLDGEIPAELSDGRLLWWKDFNEIDRRCAPEVKCAIVRLPDRAAVLRFYLKLNRGGTVHTDAEIERVRQLLAAEEQGRG